MDSLRRPTKNGVAFQGAANITIGRCNGSVGAGRPRVVAEIVLGAATRGAFAVPGAPGLVAVSTGAVAVTFAPGLVAPSSGARAGGGAGRHVAVPALTGAAPSAGADGTRERPAFVGDGSQTGVAAIAKFDAARHLTPCAGASAPGFALGHGASSAGAPAVGDAFWHGAADSFADARSGIFGSPRRYPAVARERPRRRDSGDGREEQEEVRGEETHRWRQKN